MSLGSSIQQLRLREHQLFLALTIVVGVLAGLSAVLFAVAIDWTTRLFFGLNPSASAAVCRARGRESRDRRASGLGVSGRAWRRQHVD